MKGKHEKEIFRCLNCGRRFSPWEDAANHEEKNPQHETLREDLIGKKLDFRSKGAGSVALNAIDGWAHSRSTWEDD